jgi:GNAT superfamily N-acetyltransferase
MAISITRARPEHAARLTQIAHAAKSYWGYPSQWIELWHNQLTITATYIQESEVFMAVDEDEVVLGFYGLLYKEAMAVLDHLWVEPRSLHGGVGRALFDHAVQRATAAGVERLEIESDPNAEAFYHKMGAETIGEVTYELEGMPRSLPLLAYHIGGRATSRPGNASEA